MCSPRWALSVSLTCALLAPLARSGDALAREAAPTPSPPEPTGSASSPVEEHRAERTKQTLTLRQACALADERGPALLTRRARVAEAQGGRAEAEIIPRSNPTLLVGLGPRVTDVAPRVTPAAAVQFMQTFDLGGGVGARGALVDAAVRQATAEADEAALELTREVGRAFVEARWADERLATERAVLELTDETLLTTERRSSGGDVSKLAVNVARTARARVASRVHALEAERAAAYGALRVALGVDDSVDLELTGSLPELGEFGLAELLASSKRRPELARLAAEADAAEAAYELGEVESAPQLGLGVQYDHEADLDIVLGVVQVTLPIFERGQGRRASARASGARVEIEREQLLRQLPIRVRAAYDVATKRAEALRALETQGVAPFEENVSLARRAYEAGEMTLTDLLALRTEILLSRVELLERRRDAALAVVELLVAAGMKP